MVPSLGFDTEMEKAINFYISVFNDSPHAARDTKALATTNAMLKVKKIVIAYV